MGYPLKKAPPAKRHLYANRPATGPKPSKIGQNVARCPLLALAMGKKLAERSLQVLAVGKKLEKWPLQVLAVGKKLAERPL